MSSNEFNHTSPPPVCDADDDVVVNLLTAVWVNACYLSCWLPVFSSV